MRQDKAFGFNGTPKEANPGAAHLLVVGVPGLDPTGFIVNADYGFKGIEPVELALAKLSPLLSRLS